MMRTRKLGNSNLEVSMIGLGCMGMSFELKRLDENLGAAAVELTPADLREIESAASRITVNGARYPESSERMAGR